jgi:hypothetical protein
MKNRNAIDHTQGSYDWEGLNKEEGDEIIVELIALWREDNLVYVGLLMFAHWIY